MHKHVSPFNLNIIVSHLKSKRNKVIGKEGTLRRYEKHRFSTQKDTTQFNQVGKQKIENTFSAEIMSERRRIEET